MTAPDISQTDVDALLNGELQLGARDILRLRPGAWSTAFGFTSAEDQFVVRFSEHADDFARDAYAGRFASDELPVPTVTHRGEAHGVHYAVSDRVAGSFIDELDGSGFRATLPSLLRTLNAMRTADVSSSSGYGGWDADGNGVASSWAESLLVSLEDTPGTRGEGWRAKLESSPTGAAPFDRDLPVLERLLADMPNMRSVIHSDLINFNAFAQDNRISGIIDWGCAMYGDFVYELAWFQFWSPWYPQWTGISVADEAHRYFRDLGVDLAGFEERLICYQLHIGLGHEIYNASIEGWDNLAEVTRLTTALADKVR
jgi:hygromycin-B 4-O-kinase